MNDIIIMILFCLCFKYAVDAYIFVKMPTFKDGSGKILTTEELLKSHNELIDEISRLRKRR